MSRKLIRVAVVLAIFGSGLLAGISISGNSNVLASNGWRIEWVHPDNNYLDVNLFPPVAIKNVNRRSLEVNPEKNCFELTIWFNQ